MRSSIVPIVTGMALIAAAVVLAIVFVVDLGESAGREEGVTLREVRENPERFEGQTVTISGEWAQNEYFQPAGADEVIVIGDDAGTPLLVVPELGVDVPPIDEDSVMTVEGEVRLPDRADAGFLAPDALMETEDGGVAPVVSATRVELTSGPDPPVALEADEAAIAQLLRDPRAWDERPIVVSGTVTRVTERGFTLTQDEASIFVSAPASDLSTLEQGQTVQIRAELSRLSQYGADALEKALATDPPEDQPPGALDLDDIPIERGEPYLLLRAFERSS